MVIWKNSLNLGSVEVLLLNFTILAQTINWWELIVSSIKTNKQKRFKEQFWKKGDLRRNSAFSMDAVWASSTHTSLSRSHLLLPTGSEASDTDLFRFPIHLLQTFIAILATIDNWPPRMFFRGQNLKIQVEETLLHDIRIIEESQKYTRKYQEGSLNKKSQNQQGKEVYREGNTKKDDKCGPNLQKSNCHHENNIFLTWKLMLRAIGRSKYIQSSWKRPQGRHSLHEDGEGDALIPVSHLCPTRHT